MSSNDEGDTSTYHGSLFGLFKDSMEAIVTDAVKKASSGWSTANRWVNQLGDFQRHIEDHLKDNFDQVEYQSAGYGNLSVSLNFALPKLECCL